MAFLFPDMAVMAEKSESETVGWSSFLDHHQITLVQPLSVLTIIGWSSFITRVDAPHLLLQIVVITEYSGARCHNSCILSAARWSWQPQDGKHFSGTQIMRKSRQFQQSETGTLLKLSCQVKQKMQIWCARNMKDSECNKSTWFEATELKWQSGGASGNPEVLVEWL